MYIFVLATMYVDTARRARLKTFAERRNALSNVRSADFIAKAGSNAVLATLLLAALCVAILHKAALTVLFAI